jgi:hypothetical protein
MEVNIIPLAKLTLLFIHHQTYHQWTFLLLILSTSSLSTSNNYIKQLYSTPTYIITHILLSSMLSILIHIPQTSQLLPPLHYIHSLHQSNILHHNNVNGLIKFEQLTYHYIIPLTYRYHHHSPSVNSRHTSHRQM